MQAWYLHQRAAGEGPLHGAPHVCLLMHVGSAQARTRTRQHRQRVSPVKQVRDGCDVMTPYPI